MSETKKNRTLLFTAGALIGAVCFILIYGFDILDFTYDSWLKQGSGYTGDLTQHYMGWVYFRNSSWSFPLGLTENLCYPNRISVIYTDSIPLLAIIFKLFSPILPAVFQYFGLWGLICFALQGGFAALIISRFTDSSAFCLISAVFFVVSPVMLARMFYHSALAAHWIILAALYFWISWRDIKSIGSKILIWGILTALCVMTNLYFAPIVLGIMFCALLEEFLEKREIFEPIVTLITSCGILFAVMYLLGGFYGGVSSKMGGLGDFSMNLNGLYNSQGRGYFGANIPIAQGGQNEGFSYLGMGMILLLLLAVFINFTEKRKKNIPRIVSVSLASAVFTVLALSPIITLNDKILFKINYPEVIWNILSIFRSSGRFIWVPYYIIMIFILSRISEIRLPQIKFFIVSFALAVQLADSLRVYTNSNEFFTNRQQYNSQLVSDEWADFAKRYKHIMFYAPIWDVYVTPNLGYDFGFYAKSNDMTLNGVYFSRDLSSQIDPLTLEHFEQRRQGLRNTDTLYIFPTNTPPDLDKCGIKLYEIDGIKVGLPE